MTVEPSSLIERRHGTIWIEHGFFWVAEWNTGDLLPPREIGTNGLLDAVPGRMMVHTGIATGHVRVVVERHSREPDSPEPPNDWEEIILTGLQAPVGRLVIIDAEDGEGSVLPSLTPNGPGQYAVKVHARGRDIAWDLGCEEPVEDYLLQLWPSWDQSLVIIKQTDNCGAGMRESSAASPLPQGPGSGPDGLVVRFHGMPDNVQPLRWRSGPSPADG